MQFWRNVEYLKAGKIYAYIDNYAMNLNKVLLKIMPLNFASIK